MKKYRLGEFFTKNAFWRKPQILRFIKKYDSKNIIDPFAGDGDLLKHFKNKVQIGFDINPEKKWQISNSLKKIPNISNSFIVTNPPYLSRVSSKRKKINHWAFVKNERLDLYQIALDAMIKSNMPGVAIIPETFIKSNYSKKHIYSITILIPNPFSDTETPVCVICYDPNKEYSKTRIFKNGKFIDYLENIKNIKKKILEFKNVYEIKFNDQKGDLALIGYDSSHGKTMRFLNSKKLNYKRDIKISSRVVTKISINNIKISNKIINELNIKLGEYRLKTDDILLSPFKGNFQNSDGQDRRRRLDFLTARKIINYVLNNRI